MNVVPPISKYAFEAEVSVSPRIIVGPVPGGERRIIPITGGVVRGPMLSGIVVPGGADWQIAYPGDVLDLTARYTLQADDGTYIGVVNRALRHGPAEVIARLNNSESIDQSLNYFRGSPVLEAPAGPQEWLNRFIFVATGERHPTGVLIRFFLVR